MLAVEVCIYLGCYYRLVSQHLLHLTYIYAPLEQMGGKGVAEGVRANFASDACLLGRLTYNIKYHNTCQGSAMIIQKEGVGAASIILEALALVEVDVDAIYGAGPYGDKSLLVALADNTYKAIIEE